MRFYEIAYLLPSHLSQEEFNNFQEKIISYIHEEKGILLDIKKPVKKVLGYPIKKTEKAFLFSLDFQMPPEHLKNLEKKLKKEEEILRYLILTKELAKREPEIKTIPQKARKEKVELKEIDKKLKEILAENNSNNTQ